MDNDGLDNNATKVRKKEIESEDYRLKLRMMNVEKKNNLRKEKKMYERKKWTVKEKMDGKGENGR